MPKGYFIPFTPEQEQKIKDEFLLKPVKRLADEVGATYGRIIRFLKKNNLEIPRELVEKRKLDSRKKKGDVSHSKGRKQTEYMTPEGIERSKKTRFKKGRSPSNILKVGHQRVTKDGYVEIKIEMPNKWMLKQRYVYSKHFNLTLKTTDNIIFIDGDKRNFNVDNLRCISQAENMYRNSYHNYPKEIIPTLLLTNQIKKEIQNAK